MLLHDLRLEFEGEVAQIDHLVIDRLCTVFLIETKNYAGNLLINDSGEFTVDYGEATYGIPSPIEQSRRHERILARLFDQLDISTRTGTSFEYQHVVVVHPKARITRPPRERYDTSNVIKADQFPTWHEQYVDKTPGVFQAVNGLMNLRGRDTVTEWGEKLKRQHRPANPLQLPDFMRPNASAASEHRLARAETQKLQAAPPASTRGAEPVPPPIQHAPEPQKRLVCATCNAKISFAEGKFCWNNSRRFGGLQYCREHQAAFPA